MTPVPAIFAAAFFVSAIGAVGAMVLMIVRRSLCLEAL